MPAEEPGDGSRPRELAAEAGGGSRPGLRFFQAAVRGQIRCAEKRERKPLRYPAFGENTGRCVKFLDNS